MIKNNTHFFHLISTKNPQGDFVNTFVTYKNDFLYCNIVINEYNKYIIKNKDVILWRT